MPLIEDAQSDRTAGGQLGWRRSLAQAIFLLLCAETIFAVPYRSVFLSLHSARLSWLAALVVCVLVGLGYRHRDAILSPGRNLAARAWKQERWWVLFWLGFGMSVRLAWVVKYGNTLRSDGLAYYVGASLLASKHAYSGAFWPPGFALFLAPFLALLGLHVWVTVVCSLLLFAATYGTTYFLARRLSGKGAARVAVMLVALWPTYIALTGANAKETLLVLLVTAALLFYLKSDTPRLATCLLYIAGAGALIGFASLTQPAYMLFPAVILILELFRKRSLLSTVGRTMLFTLALICVILPWTYRNYLTFHRVVLISTNGGSVFYRANNPKANASYSAEGEEILPKDEFAADKEGYRAAEAWIGANPGAFAVLAVRKQIVYLGDDGIGVYESMKRGKEPPAKLYGLAKAICNFFWLAASVLLLFGTPALFRERTWPLWFGICFLPLVYQWAIDSVFESGGRHHVSYIAFVSIMVGIVLDVHRAGVRGRESLQIAEA